MNGCELIAEERKRQIEKEGWTAEHDAEHNDGALEQAAAAYALASTIQAETSNDDPQFIVQSEKWIMTELWPWSWEWWKPKDRLRNLVRAGALIAAAIDRLQLQK